MKGAKNTVLLVGGIVGAILVGLAGYVLYGGISQFSETEERLQASRTTLETYYAQNPFPSYDNIGREKRNIDEITRWYTNLNARLKEGQIDPVKRTPGQFVTALDERRKHLRKLANASGVVLPAPEEDYAFGFDRNAWPQPEHVDVLSQHLAIIENLCTILIRSKVLEIVAVRREALDPPPVVLSGLLPNPALAAAKRAAPQQTLFKKMHFGASIRAKEGQLIEILNQLASSRMFIAVTSVETEKERPDVLPGPQVKVEGTAVEGVDERKLSEDKKAVLDGLKSKSHEERLRSGPDNMEAPMRISLEMDVYRFMGD